MKRKTRRIYQVWIDMTVKDIYISYRILYQTDICMYMLQLPTVREYIQNIFATIFNSLKNQKNKTELLITL